MAANDPVPASTFDGLSLASTIPSVGASPTGHEADSTLAAQRHEADLSAAEDDFDDLLDDEGPLAVPLRGLRRLQHVLAASVLVSWVFGWVAFLSLEVAAVLGPVAAAALAIAWHHSLWLASRLPAESGARGLARVAFVLSVVGLVGGIVAAVTLGMSIVLPWWGDAILQFAVPLAALLVVPLLSVAWHRLAMWFDDVVAADRVRLLQKSMFALFCVAVFWGAISGWIEDLSDYRLILSLGSVSLATVLVVFFAFMVALRSTFLVVSSAEAVSGAEAASDAEAVSYAA